jgi:cyclophilin family peptidyl-prolyl cis-trans isomerase
VTVRLLSTGLLMTLTACATAPPPAPPVVVPFEQKIASMLRMEDRRVLREAAPAAVAAPAPARGTAAVAPPAAPPDLVNLLADSEARVRRRAALAIGRVGLAEGVPALVARLSNDQEPEVRQMCAFALGLLARQDAVRPLRMALADAAPIVRGRAAEALGVIGAPEAAVEIATMVAGYIEAGALASVSADEVGYPLAPEVEAARLGIYALARLKAYDALASAVLSADGQPVSRWWPIAYAFRRVGDPKAASPLRALAAGDGLYTRAFAARGLGALKDAAAIEILHGLATAGSPPSVAVEAVRALGELGDARAYPWLVDLLGGKRLHAELRAEVVRAIGALGRAESTDLLLDLLTDRVPGVRAEALTALVRIDPERFLTALSGLDRDRHWSVRAALAGAVAELPLATATPLLEPMMADDDARVIPAVLEALARRRTPGAAAIALSSLAAEDPVVRGAAAAAVAELKPDGAVEALRAAIARSQSDDAYVARAAALAALVKFGREAAVPSLEAALSDKDWAVRVRARQLLGELDRTRDVTGAIRPAPTRLEPSAYESSDLVAPAFSPQAYLETDKGTIQIELAVLEAPLTVRSFIALARRGYFDGVAIHRVVANFVVQDGDPRGDGEGGPGYTLRDEINQRPYLRGTVGMALDWADTGGSQFFITHSPQPHLDTRYTVFGHVVDGLEVVDQLARGDVIRRVRVWDGRTP